jgi:hypothetical protein
MADTERWGPLSGSLVLLLVLTAATAAAAPAAPRDAALSPTSASPAAFAERAADRNPTPGATSLAGAIELIVLAVTCALVVAFYSTAAARDRTRTPSRRRRR